MGIFKRLTETLNGPTGEPLVIYGTCQRLVVGGEHYPKAHRAFRPGASVTVDLVPEPSNTYDRNAVMVVIDGQTAGYLGSSTAAAYQPLIQRANREGLRVQAAGKWELVETPSVRLDLAWPDDFERWLELPRERRGVHYETPAPEEFQMWLKRLGDYQGELESLLGSSQKVSVPVDYSLEPTERGKYQGELLIRATVRGTTIGLVPAQYRANEPGFFDAVEHGQRAGTAEIERYEERIGVKIRVANATGGSLPAH